MLSQFDRLAEGERATTEVMLTFVTPGRMISWNELNVCLRSNQLISSVGDQIKKP